MDLIVTVQSFMFLQIWILILSSHFTPSFFPSRSNSKPHTYLLPFIFLGFYLFSEMTGLANHACKLLTQCITRPNNVTKYTYIQNTNNIKLGTQVFPVLYHNFTIHLGKKSFNLAMLGIYRGKVAIHFGVISKITIFLYKI